MGPTWPFIHMFESRVERHSMVTCILRVDVLSKEPRVGASQFGIRA